MGNAYIPYGRYWSTPFAKWQGPLANMNSIRLAAVCGRQALAAWQFPQQKIDLGVLGITNIQHGSFYGLPWLTGMLGLESVAGPTVQQACATSVRVLQTAAQEIVAGSARCALVVTADRCSNGPIVYYPDGTAAGGTGHTERWVLDNFAHDPWAKNAMIDTAENVATRFDRFGRRAGRLDAAPLRAVPGCAGRRPRVPAPLHDRGADHGFGLPQAAGLAGGRRRRVPDDGRGSRQAETGQARRHGHLRHADAPGRR